MLQFILGQSGVGKTTLVHNMVMEQSEDENSKIMLIVPEQFTYETEKSLFKRLGAEKFMRVKVTSFTRLASEIFKIYGGNAGEYASESAKTIMMDMAINDLKGTLDVYQKAARNKTFPTTMLQTVTELKNAGVSPTELFDVIDKLDKGYLSQKTSEIAMIYGAYNALLYTTYQDPLDDITRASKKLQGTSFFNGYTVFFDEFKGFTANENDLIKMIFNSADNTYISLCLDLNRANESDISVFASVKDTYEKLKRFCTQQEVKIKPSIILNEQKRLNKNELIHLEQNLFSPVIKEYDGKNKAIELVLCKNEYDEVDFALSKIVELVQNEGYRYNDIVIISRDLETYITKLEVGFKKYGIPHYSDVLSKITTKPLIRFVSTAINCVTQSYRSEDILALLKCGLTRFSIEQISELENYIYIWGVKGKQWFEPFYANPRGFKESFTNEDTESLERINGIRTFVANNLVDFANSIKKTTGREICKAIINLLLQCDVKTKTEEIIKNLLEDEEFGLAQEYGRVWDILMELIDTLAITLSDNIVTPKRFEQLFSLICESYDMGTLPQSLDCVIVGSADRIRTTNKKALFVLGVNENVLPYVPSTGGVFTDKEREQLISLEIEISPPVKNRILEERFIAYKTLCSPSEKLYLTARKSDISGKAMSPSIIFSQIKRMFTYDIVQDTDFINGLFYCKSKITSFSYLAKTYYEDTQLTVSLKQVLGEDELYNQKLKSLEKIAEQKPFEIENKQNAKKLFGDKMNISPTRVEGFYQCRFKYFCEHGLRVYPLRKAELNPLETGTLIHSIIYAITKQVDLKTNFDEKHIKKLIKQELDLYIEQVMGGVEDKSKRVLYLYNRMRISIFKVIYQLYIELKQSRFEPCDYEYEISNENDITPLILNSEDGTEISISGKIDRIDSYVNKNGEKYIRIVDYKSGKKIFKLNDVLYGLNLQMLIYLFCISKNGKGKYENSLPAGILYMPASEQTPSLSREATEDDTKKAQASHYKMNGLLIQENDVLDAMDSGLKGVFIPVTTKLDGNFTSQSLDSLVTLKELSKVSTYINKLITNMATELHLGKIQALPIENSCEYCNYSGVCGTNSKSACREYFKYDRQELIKQMGGDEDNDNNEEQQ